MKKIKKSLQQQQSQSSSSQDNSDSDSPQNDYQDGQGILKQQENLDIPFPEFRKSFSIFNDQKKTNKLRSYIKSKSDKNIENLKKTFSFYSQNTNILNLSDIKKDKMVPCEHIFLFKLPDDVTVFVHIYKIDKLRCNMRIINSTGYVIAYFCEIKLSRKFHKIFKILKIIPMKSLLVIYDQILSIEKEGSFLKKISTYSNNFCYYSQRECEINFQKIYSFQVQNQNLTSLCINMSIWLSKGYLYLLSDNLTKKQNHFQQHLRQLQKVQLEVQNENKNIISLNIDDCKGTTFVLESILINFVKSNTFKTNTEMEDSFRQMINSYLETSKHNNKPQFGDIDDHYLQKMRISKKCINCKKTHTKNSKDKKISKTKFRCIGCSAQEKNDFPLCPECTELYHIKKFAALKAKIQKTNLKTLNKQKAQGDLRQMFKNGKKHRQSDKKHQQTGKKHRYTFFEPLEQSRQAQMMQIKMQQTNQMHTDNFQKEQSTKKGQLNKHFLEISCPFFNKHSHDQDSSFQKQQMSNKMVNQDLKIKPWEINKLDLNSSNGITKINRFNPTNINRCTTLLACKKIQTEPIIQAQKITENPGIIENAGIISNSALTYNPAKIKRQQQSKQQDGLNSPQLNSQVSDSQSFQSKCLETVLKSRKLLQNNSQFKRILKEIDIEKSKFIQTFKLLVGKRQTRNGAMLISEFLKLTIAQRYIALLYQIVLM